MYVPVELNLEILELQEVPGFDVMNISPLVSTAIHIDTEDVDCPNPETQSQVPLLFILATKPQVSVWVKLPKQYEPAEYTLDVINKSLFESDTIETIESDIVAGTLPAPEIVVIHSQEPLGENLMRNN